MPIAKSTLKRGVKAAADFAADVASDAVEGKNIRQSFITHGKRQAKNVGRHAVHQGKQALTKQLTQPRRETLRKRPATSKAKQKPKRPRYNY